jgi:mono/diheme cytochrome c family protein
MIRPAIAAIVSLIIIASPFAAAAQPDEGQPRWAANLVRKQQVIMHGVPRPYVALRDRQADTSAKIARGRMIFDRECSACHGWSGEGNGPSAFAQVPAPADLEWIARTPRDRAQPYLYWTIAEGGNAFDSEMPAYKRKLSGRDIWSVIAYLRAGMPRKSP